MGYSNPWSHNRFLGADFQPRNFCVFAARKITKTTMHPSMRAFEISHHIKPPFVQGGG
jgi:hypothetical protein